MIVVVAGWLSITRLANAASLTHNLRAPSDDLIVTQTPRFRSALDEGSIGLYPIGNFYQTTGRCRDCTTIRQALAYFEDETIAVPREGTRLAAFTPGVRAQHDIAQWATTHAVGAPIDYPPLVWIGSPEVIRGARLDASGRHIDVGGSRLAFDIVPRIPLNRSYFNQASIAFLADRPLTLRGASHDGGFTARTIWPEDFRLDGSAGVRRVDATPNGVRALVREQPRGGAQSPFAAFTLWERTTGAALPRSGAPVLAVMLNGAQGDDDEAHGGHFTILTGHTGNGGAIGDWLANNFYTLDSYSEKGIIAAALPLDNYLGDLNSGQGWYRPSYLIVAILNDERCASHIQSAFARIYNQFYRHQLVYRHPSMNCASISVDVLRALGWNVRARGPTSRGLAAVGVPFYALRERSWDKAAQAFDYLTEDRTRLFPAAAFEEIGADLLRFAQGAPGRRATPFETMLGNDIDALVFLHVPQIPSSRTWGDYPVVTAWEYNARFPADPKLQKIIPVPPRPFPEEMRDPDLLPPPRRQGETAVAIWAVLSVVGIPWLLWKWWKPRAERRNTAGPR